MEDLKPGDKHYKAYVGPIDRYDLMSALQFNLLTFFGLRANQKMLDIGCGSLRLGKLLIPYLDRGNYFGIEPNEWLVRDGFKNEIGNEVAEIKKPTFIDSMEFEISQFQKQFDYMIAQSIFSHTSKKQIETCLNEVKSNLNAKGFFLATFVHGKSDYEGNEWVYPGIVQFTKRYIKKVLDENGLYGYNLEGFHPKQNWYVISHTKNRNYIRKRCKEIKNGRLYKF